MKVVTLNLWGGKLHKELFDFIKNSNADIFCFQEVFSNLPDSDSGTRFIKQENIRKKLFQEIETLKPEMSGFFTPTFGPNYGIAMFVKGKFKIKNQGDILIYDNKAKEKDPSLDEQNRCLQWIVLEDQKKDFVIMNLHGYWTRDGLDHQYNFKQIENVLNKVNSFSGLPIILAGDFNLRPDTKSIGLLDEHLSNLIRKYNIKSTRTSYCPYPIRHADYVFVNDLVKVKSFEVLPDEVSDHNPLMLDFNL